MIPRCPPSLCEPHRKVNLWLLGDPKPLQTCGRPSVIDNAEAALEWMALFFLEHPWGTRRDSFPLTPFAAPNDAALNPRLQRLTTAPGPLQLGHRRHHLPDPRDSAKENRGDTFLPISWPRAEASRGRAGPQTPRGSKKEDSLISRRGSTRGKLPASTRLSGVQDRIPLETLHPLDNIRVVLVTLVPHMICGHIKNIAAASYGLTVGDGMLDVISMYHYPEASCKLTVRGDMLEVNSRYHYLKSDPGPDNSEENHPCCAVLSTVWACEAPFSEGLTSAFHRFHLSHRVPTPPGSARDTPLRRRDPACTAGLKGVIPSGRANQSCAAGLKGVIPIRRVNHSCTAGLKGVIPSGRVNQSCTAEWEGEYEEIVLIGLHSRPGIRCSERDVLRRTMMPLDAPEIGEKRGRTICVEIGILRFHRGPWRWPDRRDWNCVAAFTPFWHDCCDSDLVVAVTSEQNDLVSSLLYNPIHLFSPYPDLPVTNLLWWKEATLFCRLTSSWETQEQVLRNPRGSDPTPVSRWAIVTATILPEFPFPSTALQPAPDPTATTFAPSPRDDMGLRTRLCVLLLGLVFTSSTSRIHRSATLGSLMGLLSVVSADRFTLRNGYGTVEARYHLTAYDCSDPSEVQAYSSIPASHCSTRATPVRNDRPT